MSETMDNVAYLSQQIGPRPAGTEEEQQAALYITEQLQKEAGLPAVIEDFNNVSNSTAVRTLCCVVMILATVLSLILPVVAVPCVLLTVVAAVFFVLETLGRPLLSRLLPKGVSQNVVAKHEPGYAPGAKGARRRKVVVVAHYDSGKVKAELNGPAAGILPILRLAVLGGAVFLALFSLVRLVFFSQVEGGAAAACNVLTVVALVLVALPVVGALAEKLAAYNEGANCNAAGVAVLIDVAARVGRGRENGEGGQFAFDAAFDPAIHGEEAAYAAGLVPEGAQLVYEEASTQPVDDDQAPEARLAAAKAAVAALSGKPVSGVTAADIAKNLVQVKKAPLAEPTPDDLRALREETHRALGGASAGVSGEADELAGAPGAEGAGNAEAGWADGAQGDVLDIEEMPGEAASLEDSGAGDAAPVPTGDATGDGSGAGAAASSGGVPDWFKRAQQNAKKPADEGAPIHRSRYADALPTAASAAPAGAAEAAETGRDLSSSAERELGGSSEKGRGQEASGQQAGKGGDVAASATDAPAPEGAGASTLAGDKDEFDVSGVGFAADGEAGQGDESLADVSSVAQVASDGEVEASPEGRRRTVVPFDVDDLRVGSLPEQPEVGIPAFLQGYPAAPETDEAVGVGAIDGADGMEDGSAALPRVDAAAEDSPAAGAPTSSASTGESPAAGDPASAGDPAPSNAAARVAEPRRRPIKRRPITLPDVGAAPAPVSMESQKQRAPLADVESSGKTAAKRLLTMLPSIDLGKRSNVPSQDASQADGSSSAEGAASAASRKSIAQLRTSLPSLSGSLAAQAAVDDGASGEGAADAERSENGAFEAAGASGRMAPVIAGATGSFAPVGEELLQNMDPDDIYVEDADDSAYEGNVTETGAFAGPGYVEMPKSRMQRLLSKLPFGKKDREEEITTQEWLDVDESFDARSVGAARGSWESFRNDEDATAASEQDGEFGEFDGSGNGVEETYAEQSPLHDAWDEEWSDWEDQPLDDFGAGFSQEASGSFPSSGSESGLDPADTLANLPVEDVREGLRNEGFQQETPDRLSQNRRRWNGGAFSERMMDGSEEGEWESGGEEAFEKGRRDYPLPEMDLSDEMEQIQNFRNSGIDTEVWFVALGAELAQNGGMRAFLAEHAQELRGAIIVELDGLGAGELSLVEREGTYRTVRASSRMKRYVKKATRATGVQAASMTSRLGESAASFATKQGYQAMHLVGADGAKPAYFAQGDDVLENVEEEKILQNADFVMELLRSI